MRRHSLMLRTALLTTLTCLVSLLVVSAAQAVVVDDNGDIAGVALVPGTRADLGTAGISAVTSTAPCEDPWLSSDLGGPFLPSNGLCYRGGNVMHANETFALTWDANRYYWEGTRNYMEQYLSDVAGASGSLSSPYALTAQYSDGTGRAAYKSVFGGGCIDYGSTGGSTCKFGSTTGSGAGNDFPSSVCPVTGTNQFYQDSAGAWGNGPNNQCLTDAQIRSEVQSMVSQDGLLGHVDAGYTPLIAVLTPPGTVVCLDSAGNLCSANSSSTAQFCSYHSEVNVDGTEVDYLVVPWTASWTAESGIENNCDDPDLPAIPLSVTTAQIATDVGAQLVSPLSQAQLAAITDPSMDEWVAQDGSEINDNGCVPEGPGTFDQAEFGAATYFVQREFNNAGVLESDPDAPKCAPNVLLQPNFVLPSSVQKGDEVQLDGSTSVSTLMIPKANYVWSFGDGTEAVGPSVVHTFSTAGTYPVKLTVTDRGGYTLSLAQTINITGTGSSTGPAGLVVHLQLMPQALRSVLKSGLRVRLGVNQNVSGIATVSITRGEARRAHIKGRGSSVVIGRGTISSVKAGTASLRLRLSHRIVKKLRRLRTVTFTVRLALVGSAGGHVAIDAAGRY